MRLRVLAALVCVLAFGVPAVAVAAEPVAAVVVADPVLAQDTTAPPGPTIDPEGNERADAEKTKNKLVVGGIAALLLVIVLFGRSRRKKNSAD